MDGEATVELDAQRPIVLFDGVCTLCNGLVQFLLAWDRRERLRFGSLQSETATELLDRIDHPHDDLDSIVVIEGDRVYTKSAGVLRVFEHLGPPFSLLYVFGHLPQGLRDWVYDLVADYRYQVFGQKDQCMVPSPEVRERFLDGPGGSA